MPPRTKKTTIDELSPEAAELVAAGAVPSTVDVAAMMRTIRELQATVTEIQSDRGIPSDPVGAAFANLKAHFAARQTMHRRKEDLAELKDILEEIEDPSLLSTEDSAFVVEVCNAVPNTVEGVDYLRQLARDLHHAVRNSEPEEEIEKSEESAEE